MELVLIAAQASNRVIGKKGELPWYISEDLKRFKHLTLNHPVIMGRKTYETIVKRLGKPLPDRTNIVLTKQHKEQQGVFFCSTPEEALKIAQQHGQTAYVIGGQTIYEQFMPLATALEITHLHHEVEGDAFFPLINEANWQLVKKEDSGEGGMSYSFVRYERREADDIIYQFIEKEAARQQYVLNMIPSENYTSKAVREACGSVLMHKYSEGYPARRYYQGNEFVDSVEQIAIQRAKELFGAEHANVQPYSGSPANLAILHAFLKPGESFMGLDLASGGHLTHGSPVNASGTIYRAIPYSLNKETHLLDMPNVRAIALEHKPKLIISGLTAYPRTLNFRAFQDIAEEIGAIHLADISHIAGLIVAGAHPSPLPFTDVVMTTTHKTLRGPRGAIILCKEKYAKQIDKAVFPGMQGGPHENVIAAKAIAFKEARTPEFKNYAHQTVKNAQALANTLLKESIPLITGGTDNHLILIDARSFGIGRGKELAIALEAAGICANANSVPYDPSPPMKPSGIRLGTPILTTRGMREPEMQQVGQWIAQVIKNPTNSELHFSIKSEVWALCERFPL